MRTIALQFRAWVWMALAISAALPCGAQLPVARLTSIFPPGGRAGSQIEVTVTGSDLDDATQLYFSRPSVTATSKINIATGEPVPNTFVVRVADNAAPGPVDVRVLNRFGLSNPRTFVVSASPAVIAPTTNSSPGSATELAADTVMNGRARANEAAWFEFTARAGERFFIDCQSKSLDSRMEPTLLVTDASGRELERNRTGGALDFTAPTAGSYRLRVADLLFRGGDDYVYRLMLRTGAQVDFVFPPSGSPGTTVRATVFGRNLPGGAKVPVITIDGRPLEKVEVDIEFPADPSARRQLRTAQMLPPAGAALDGFDFVLPTPRGPANPVLLTFATAPVVVEQEPNDQPVTAQSIAPPCEVAGQFFPARDVDTFTFTAKKGEVYWLEVFSHRLGLPTDPFLLVQRVTKNERGEERATDVHELYDFDTNLGDREFNTVSRDPATRFEAKEDGVYRLIVRDQFHQTTASPRNVYRLSVRRAAPSFRLVTMPISPKYKADAKDVPLAAPGVRRGETVPLRVMAFRRDGFSDAIDLGLEDAPSGLSGLGRIEAGKGSGTLFLTAAADASFWAGPIKIVGRATAAGGELVREARAATARFNVGNYDNERVDSRLAQECLAAVIDQESAAISITVPESKTWEVTGTNPVTIPFVVTRRGEFNATLKLKPTGAAALDALKELEIDGKATNATLTLDPVALKLSPGRYTFALQTQTTGKYRNNPEAAARADAAAKEADQLAVVATEALKKAAEALDKCDAESKPAAEKTKAAAETQAKQAKAKKESTAARAKELNQRAAPRDVSVMVYSQPIQLSVRSAKER